VRKVVDERCPVTLVNGPDVPYQKDLPKHKKNPEIGTKKTTFAKTIYLDAEDAAGMTADEEVRSFCVMYSQPR
jgi:glutamyl-tRNA synthetase